MGRGDLNLNLDFLREGLGLRGARKVTTHPLQIRFSLHPKRWNGAPREPQKMTFSAGNPLLTFFGGFLL